MYTEATLDFPEEDVEFLRAGDVERRLADLRAQLAQVLAHARTGALLREGLTVVLVGEPNVGKSSLLNALAREEAAIVTPIPGTTRDPVERVIEIAGIPLTVVDTAGLRDTDDAVERIGIARTWAAVERADLVVLIVDARGAAQALPAAERAILARLPAALPRVVVHNKTDLAAIAPHADARADDGATARHVWLSAKTGDGVALLEREVLAVVGADHATEDAYLARERHVVALREAADHLTRRGGARRGGAAADRALRRGAARSAAGARRDHRRVHRRRSARRDLRAVLHRQVTEARHGAIRIAMQLVAIDGDVRFPTGEPYLRLS